MSLLHLQFNVEKHGGMEKKKNPKPSPYAQTHVQSPICRCALLWAHEGARWPESHRQMPRGALPQSLSLQGQGVSPTGDCRWLAERTGEYEFICTGKSSWYPRAHHCSLGGDDFRGDAKATFPWQRKAPQDCASRAPREWV